MGVWWRGLVLFGMLVAGQGVFANERDGLIAQIVAAGSNDGEKERHKVAIKECTMTTYRWNKQDDGTLKLWTSFVFYMPDVFFEAGKDGKKFVFAPDVQGPDLALVIFSLKEGKTKIQEFAAERNIKGPSEPSPRNDGTTHRIRETPASFIYSHYGEGVDLKAEAFTAGFEQYVREYCTFLG